MCNLIIITSSVPLSYWFRHMMYNKSEDLQQFYRRIAAYIEITADEVSVYEKLDNLGRPSGFPTIYRNKIAQIKAQPKKEKTDFGKAFAAICEEIPIEDIIEMLNAQADKKFKR